MSETIIINESELIELIELYRNINEKQVKHDPDYDAEEGTTRDKKLDRARRAYKRGDIELAAKIRNNMEEKERKKKSFKSKHTKESIVAESIMRNQYLSEEYKNENAEIFLNDRIEEIKLYSVLDEYEDYLEEKKKASGKLSAAVKKSLDKKADRRCLTRGSVYSEFRKGLAAWLSSGSRKGMGQHQWAHARVNSANPSKSWATVKKRKKCPKKKK